jgi:hypothetical protein
LYESRYLWFDPTDEETFSLKSGHPTVPQHYKQLLKYAKEGVAVGREIIRLRVCRLPHTLGTSLEEYRRFISACNRATAKLAGQSVS